MTPRPELAVQGATSIEMVGTARNATALALSSVARGGLLFLWQLVLARWLGAERYGVYGTIGALVAIGAAVPEFGMGLIVVRDVARRPQDAGRYLAATLVLQPALAGLGYGGLLVAALFLGYGTELRGLLAFAAVNLLVDALGNMCHNQLLAAERMALTAGITVAHVTLLVVLAGAALATGGGLWGLYAATLVAGLARAGGYWFALRRNGCRPVFPLDPLVVRALLANGLPLATMALLVLAHTHADKLVTTVLLGPAGTGQLTAGFVIVFGVIELLNTTVLVAVLPLMSRTHAAGRPDRLDLMLEKLTVFTMLVGLPIAVCTSLLAAHLAAWLFGEGFARTGDVLRILAWYTIVAMVANVFAEALTVQNRQTRLLVARTTGLLLNVGLTLALLPRVGVPGAAAATLTAETVVLALILGSFDLSVGWWARVLDHVWRLGIAALGLAGVILFLRGLHPVAAAAVGVPVYAALVLTCGALAADDRDLLYGLLTAMPGGAVIRRCWKRQAA